MYNIMNRRTVDIMFSQLYSTNLLSNAMVRSTEMEGSGLLGGGMPSALMVGKHVPLSITVWTQKEPLSIGPLYFY